MRKKLRKWTEQEVLILREYYESEGSSCSARFGFTHSRRTIVNKARKLGLCCNKSVRGRLVWQNPEYKKMQSTSHKNSEALAVSTNKWSIQEDAIIREYYPIEGSECGKRLDRTSFAIWARARILGVSCTKPRKGRAYTEEEKQRVSSFHKIYQNLPEVREAKSWRFSGENHPRGMKGKHLSKETKKKISNFHKGKKLTKEHKLKIGKANTGPNNGQWRGGIKNYPYPQGWKDDLKDAIRKRDEHRCGLCSGFMKREGYRIPVHHIDYNKDNLDPLNLICLCGSCHAKTNTNRTYWISYFRAMMQESVGAA